MFRFAEPGWLAALALSALLPLFFWWTGSARRRALARLGEEALIRRLTASVSGTARAWKAALLTLAPALLVLAAARPQFGTTVETVRVEGQDIMVVLDLSRSMLAEDVPPNRLERAKLAVLRLIRKLDGDRIGLVAFAGDAFVQMPLTIDYDAAAMFLRAMHPDRMPLQGTDLGAAIRVSLDALEEAGREERVLLLITDGEHHEGSFDEQIQRARAMGVRIYTVGVGSPEGVPIPLYDAQGRRQGFLRDEDGSVVTTRLDEATLMRLAEATGGRYVRAGIGGTAFDDLVDELAAASGEALEERRVVQYEEQYQIFLGMALLLLLVEWVIPERRRAGRRAGSVGPLVAALVVALCGLAAPAPVGAQSVRNKVEEGNRLYDEGRYQEAHQAYLEALELDPASAIARFNAGDALYRAQAYDRAVEAYAEALQHADPDVAAAAWYNLGNALYRVGRLQESLEAYKQALRLRPDDLDAKVNFEQVLEELRRRQQQQQQQRPDAQEQQSDGQGRPQPQDPQPQEGEDQRDEPDQQGREERQDRQSGEQGPQQGPQEPQDQQGPEGAESPGEGADRSRDGEMTPEEARRLLEAVREDPDELAPPKAPARGRRPRKPW